jgi:hypothetical protein
MQSEQMNAGIPRQLAETPKASRFDRSRVDIVAPEYSSGLW